LIISGLFVLLRIIYSRFEHDFGKDRYKFQTGYVIILTGISS